MNENADKPTPDTGAEMQPGESPIEQAAQLVTEWAQMQGYTALPLYFAVGVVAAPGTGHPSILGGQLRHHFAEAYADAVPIGGAVGFVVLHGMKDDPQYSETLGAALEEKRAGLDVGTLPHDGTVTKH